MEDIQPVEENFFKKYKAHFIIGTYIIMGILIIIFAYLYKKEKEKLP